MFSETTRATVNWRKQLGPPALSPAPDPGDTHYLVDYAFLLRDRDGSARVVHDRHVEGLFSRQLWLDLLTEVGFEARSTPFVHPEVEPGRREMFVGRRPR